MTEDLSPELRRLLEQVTGRRARIVIDHILAHDYISTEDLEQTYGYRHPPRAVRDVREQGIPIETFFIENHKGKRIGAYRFSDLSQVEQDRLGGRRFIPAAIKEALIERDGQRCALCLTEFDKRFLQVDHRVPYEVAGDSVLDERTADDFMLVCRSCNRAKSWTCEHCDNFAVKSVVDCLACYWASPTDYDHIALRPIRRVEVVWEEEEIPDFESLRQQALDSDKSLAQYIKAVLIRHLNKPSDSTG